jgi:carbon monoxide dehydrogenase subunit G
MSSAVKRRPKAVTEEGAMATIRKEAQIDASPERVWDALRDVGALHTRLVPGFVVDARMDGNARVVTFGNGMVAREDIVSVDERTRRVTWAIVGQQFHHYNGAAQVLDDDSGARFVWTTDLLPDELAGTVAAMMEAGIAVIKKTMEAG